MESPALREMTERVRGGGIAAVAGLTVEAALGKIAHHLDRQEQEQRRMDRDVQPILIPAVSFPVSGGVLSDPVVTSLLGPEDGYAWDVRRITVSGLTGALTVSLWREINTPTAGNPENFLWTFSAPGTSPGPTWNPGGGLILRSPEAILLTGTGLTGLSSVVLNGEGVQIAMPWLSRYVL